MCLRSASPFLCVLRWSLRTIASDVASYRFRGLIVRILFSRTPLFERARQDPPVPRHVLLGGGHE